MQYWPLLSLPRLRPVSRFQLLFAILMYLGSPAWMAMVAIGAGAVALGGVPAAAHVGTGAGAVLFAIILIMIFAPKIASALDVLTRPQARKSYGGGALFLLNVIAETIFSFLLSPILAFSHTLFLLRLCLLRAGGVWSGQSRESHAVPWRLAIARLWPHTLAGVALLAITGARTGDGVVYALIAAGGLALAVPIAVATAAPSVGMLFARLGLGRIPEEIDPPRALLALQLPTEEESGRRREDELRIAD